MTSVDSLFIAFQDALSGRYSIDRELGRGGMGIVYLAREVHLDRMVAINLLRLHAGGASVQSLTTHLSLAAQVSASVERLVAAHEEVDRTLKFPRAIAPSPA